MVLGCYKKVIGSFQEGCWIVIGWLQDGYRIVLDGYRMDFGLLYICYKMVKEQLSEYSFCRIVLRWLQDCYSMVLDRIIQGWLQDVIGQLQDDVS